MDLYATLSLDSSSNDQDIKRAYKNLALKNHPDRFPHASEDQRKQLTDTFQKLSQAYAILSDTNKKARYDATGSIDDIADLQEGFATWTEYFETIFTRLTEEAIEKYEKQYKFSELERDDVLEAYVAQKGYLLKLIEHVPLSTLADLDRFQKIIQDAIDAGTVPLIKPFPKINKKELAKMQREMEQEAKEAEEIASRDTGDMESLKKAIQRQSQQRSEALISRLEEQYVNDEDDSKASKKRNQKKRKAASTAEPTEEEFMALQAKLFDKPKKATR